MDALFEGCMPIKLVLSLESLEINVAENIEFFSYNYLNHIEANHLQDKFCGPYSFTS